MKEFCDNNPGLCPYLKRELSMKQRLLMDLVLSKRRKHFRNYVDIDNKEIDEVTPETHKQHSAAASKINIDKDNSRKESFENTIRTMEIDSKEFNKVFEYLDKRMKKFDHVNSEKFDHVDSDTQSDHDEDKVLTSQQNGDKVITSNRNDDIIELLLQKTIRILKDKTLFPTENILIKSKHNFKEINDEASSSSSKTNINRRKVLSLLRRILAWDSWKDPKTKLNKLLKNFYFE